MIFGAVIYAGMFVASVFLSLSAKSAASRKDWPNALSCGLLSLSVAGAGFSVFILSALGHCS